jgi:hypothetical protein
MKKFLKQIDIPQLGLQVTLTLPEASVYLWSDDGVEFNSTDIKREVSLHIIPLIEAGVLEDETRLLQVHYEEFSMESGEGGGKGIGNPVFSWKAHRPWWHPDNDEWGKTPFCGRLMVA